MNIYGTNFHKMFGIGHSNIFVYQFITGDIRSKDLLVLQYLILSGLVFFVIIISQNTHMFYEYIFSQIAAVIIVKVNGTFDLHHP